MDVDFSGMIRRARCADPHAINEFLDAYRNYLRVLAQLWLPERLRSLLDPSDLVQETLVKANRGFQQFQGATEVELTSWLRRILSRALIDIARKHGRTSNEISLDREIVASGDKFQQLLANSGTSPSQHACRRELGVLLADAMARLPERQRQVIILRSLQEQEWKDVASAMDRTISSVRAMWMRALSNLRTHLEEVLK